MTKLSSLPTQLRQYLGRTPTLQKDQQSEVSILNNSEYISLLGIALLVDNDMYQISTNKELSLPDLFKGQEHL